MNEAADNASRSHTADNMELDDIAEILRGDGESNVRDAAPSFPEAMAQLQRAMANSEDVFSNLPSFQRIREKWIKNGISEDDAAWILIEAASTQDQREHLRAAALIKVIAAQAEVMRFTVTESGRIVHQAALLETSVSQANGGLNSFNKEIVVIASLLKRLSEGLSPLIDYIHRAMKILEDRTVKAALLQVGIILVTAIGAVALDRLVIALWGR